MKKLLIISFLTLVSVYAFSQNKRLKNPATDDKDVEATAILNKVSAKYRQYNIVKTDFDFTLDNKQANIKDTQYGTLIAQSKTNKFKVTVYASGTSEKQEVAEEIISDGKTQWTYIKKDNEVQINNADNSGQGINPAQIFTMYQHGYKYIYNGDTKIDGRTYQEIDLTPVDIDKPFFKVRLEIDKLKKQIHSALIFDKNGNRYTYVLRSFVPDIQVPENTFTFDPKYHTGVEVVDLR